MTDDPEFETLSPDTRPKLELEEILKSKNIAELLNGEQKRKIASTVLAELDNDIASRKSWEDKADRCLELANMDTQFTGPWEGSANINFPMIARAGLQFGASIVKEMIKNKEVCQMIVNGLDPEGTKKTRADNVSKYMNYLLMTKDTKWQEGFTRAVQLAGIIGTVFKKQYYNPITEDYRSDLCLHKEIVVNHKITSLDEARRISHIQTVHTNDLISYIRLGLYSELEDAELKVEATSDEAKNHVLVEQHCYLDLDGDNYEEPYIVIVHKELRKVLRICRRFEQDDVDYNDDEEILKIKPEMFFTDYHCIPNFDGGYHSIGYGFLLLTLNEVINTGYNQLINAGHLASTTSGLISGALQMRSGSVTMKMGEFIKINTLDGNIRDHIHEFNFKEPSTVLFQLMGMVDQTSKELSSTTDLMSGNELSSNARTGAVYSMLDRGLTVYSSIQKSMFRGVSRELKSLYDLVKTTGNPIEYQTVLDDPIASLLDDFEDESLDIQPVADPILSSSVQRLAQVEVVKQLNAEMPGVLDPTEIAKRVLIAADVQNIDILFNRQPPQPSIDELKLQSEEKIKMRELDLKEAQMQIDYQLKVQDMELQKAKLEKDDTHKVTKELQNAESNDIKREQIQTDFVKHDKEQQVNIVKSIMSQETEDRKLQNAPRDSGKLA